MMKKYAWEAVQGDKGAYFRHVATGWIVRRYVHVTSATPYYLLTPDGAVPPAPHDRDFETLHAARRYAEWLIDRQREEQQPEYVI